MNYKPNNLPSGASLTSSFKSLVLLTVCTLALCSSGVGQQSNAEASFPVAGAVHVDWDSFGLATLECKVSTAIEDSNSLWDSAYVLPASAGDISPIATISKGEFKLSDNRSDGSLGDDDRGEKLDAALKSETRLARVTVYWPGEGGDHYTRRRLSSSGVRLRDGHCAVDPQIIPYGSVVKIPGMGKYVAVDTGSAVVARRAARAAGRTPDERNALVVDVYCSSRAKAREIEATADKFALVTWYR
ncbi:MAG: 3D domain-containing protein [Terrimicrobiaceae bacterium]